MTTPTAALVLAWAAIILLTLATAGILRRVEALSAAGAMPTSRREPAARGLKLPVERYLSASGVTYDRALLLVFVTPSCAVCQTVIDELSVADPLLFEVIIVTKSTTIEPLSIPPHFIKLTSALELSAVMAVPATPYIARVGIDGTIVDASIVTPGLDVAQWASSPALFATQPGH